jgi:hypothetical protein
MFINVYSRLETFSQVFIPNQLKHTKGVVLTFFFLRMTCECIALDHFQVNWQSELNKRRGTVH